MAKKKPTKKKAKSKSVFTNPLVDKAILAMQDVIEKALKRLSKKGKK